MFEGRYRFKSKNNTNTNLLTTYIQKTVQKIIISQTRVWLDKIDKKKKKKKKKKKNMHGIANSGILRRKTTYCL